MKTERIVTVLKGAAVDILISAYGNEFFVAGQKGVDYRKSINHPAQSFQRNTLMAICKLGFLQVRPGMAGRGEFSITDKGREFLKRYAP